MLAGAEPSTLSLGLGGVGPGFAVLLSFIQGKYSEVCRPRLASRLVCMGLAPSRHSTQSLHFGLGIPSSSLHLFYLQVAARTIKYTPSGEREHESTKNTNEERAHENRQRHTNECKYTCAGRQGHVRAHSTLWSEARS